MSIQINIQGTVIDLPSSGQSPNWAQGVITAFQAIADALQLAVGTYDVTPQTQNIDATDAGTADITALLFDPSQVRAATIYITTHRANTTGPVVLDEFSILEMNYHSANSSGQKWVVNQERIGSANISFDISDTGQVSFTTTSSGAGTNSGFVSFYAKTLTNS